MAVALSLLALGVSTLQGEGQAYDPSLLDPGMYGLRVEMPVAEWRRVALESVSSRLVYEPRAVDGKGDARRPYVRLRLVRVPDRRAPELDSDWENAKVEIIDSFREAFSGGVQLEGVERVRVAEIPALEIRLKLKEADGVARTAVSTVFFYGGDAWRLELIATDEAFERHVGSYRAIRSGIAVRSWGLAAWGVAGGAVLAAAVVAWLAGWGRRERE